MNIEQLTVLRTAAREKLLVRDGEKSKDGYEYHVLVCGGTGCVSSGCKSVRDTLIDEIKNRGLEEKVRVIVTGCLGPCNMGPIVTIYPDGTFYQRVKADDAVYIVREHLEQGRHIEGLMYRSPETGKLQDRWQDIDYFRNQKRLVLRNCGFIDPLSLEEYIARDGYAALAAVLEADSPEKVIDEITISGLRGRGGAGFPTGLKWGFVRKAPGTPKYVVCNGDEGDPGAFMDRSVLEGDPHSVLEGMVIGAYAVGASQGYAYIRAEYPLAIKNFTYAIELARANGLLGKNILGMGFDFDVEVRVGAGAFVCGEETALLESIMGRRGEPRPRPPFPAQEGLFGKPTTINNVETWANVPLIIHRGGEYYASIGTEKSKGTKVFALAGKVNNTGLVEVPLGTTLRQVIYDIGGGVPNGKALKAVQTGGPSGGAIPAKFVDVPISYESLAELGSIMGSGGMIVLDEDSCMVDLARFFMDFVQEESCGKCTPCRIGTRRMSEILTKMTQGRGTPEDLELLIELANVVKNSALCGLGQTAPNPVLSTTSNYRDEYDTHVKEQKCPTGVCPMRVAPSRVRK
ncbi:MAG: NADH-quinone oxidoreductase subunit NuoF [Firmicutes bacterium]|nr:NADH-quinone oxidoreductase subunit NuoF [Bacillota bacterium]MBV1727043.1 NADH-quinone oxidoreductase subunit NuoF [Desulforudis sp.]MBU4533097.1 NADH-quinone oxidoreductase subunit NuoF [Bacillota bacterium]MBU4554985.1 NADH-quinone oxidoreductase subunit NuoF [Bacillota bacterium]MBV1735191.1 NADH-quinone oxidoreductase subunit NuoF [Desulforudis sp.]